MNEEEIGAKQITVSLLNLNGFAKYEKRWWKYSKTFTATKNSWKREQTASVERHFEISGSRVPQVAV